jgi:hypothetical protein
MPAAGFVIISPAGTVYPEVRFAHVLRFIEGVIRLLLKLHVFFHVAVLIQGAFAGKHAPVKGGARAQGHGNGFSLYEKRVGFQGRENFDKVFVHTGFVRGREEGVKFFSSVAYDVVRGTGIIQYAICNVHEDLVPGVMAMEIIDPGKIIDIKTYKADIEFPVILIPGIAGSLFHNLRKMMGIVFQKACPVINP